MTEPDSQSSERNFAFRILDGLQNILFCDKDSLLP